MRHEHELRQEMKVESTREMFSTVSEVLLFLVLFRKGFTFTGLLIPLPCVPLVA